MKDVDREIVKEAINKAIGDFSEIVAPLGFTHTQKWFWVREKAYGADFIHLRLNGSSYGPSINYSLSFRVHFGHREYDSEFEGLALNGPCSSDAEYLLKRYHHRFNAKSGSTYERCITDLGKCVNEIGNLWFSQLKPQNPHQFSQERLAKSRKLLGLKNVKK